MKATILDLGGAAGTRILIRERITDIIATFDDHDPGVLNEDDYRCRCGWTGTGREWEVHLAEALGETLTVETVELP